MIAFIKTYTLKNINYKLLILYVLNLTDILFTMLLLSTGCFMEGNILMRKAVQSIPASFLLKFILPALLLFYISLRIRNASEMQLKQSNTLLSIITAAYALINISHILCFSLFLSLT